jgi:Transcriptional regulatory protein, C terminal
MSAAESLHLAPTEWQLLGVLARNPGKLVSQRQLLQAVWGPSYLTETDYLAPVHEPTAPQARAGPHPPTAPHHRAGHGLPVPVLSSRPFMPQPATVIDLAPGE